MDDVRKPARTAKKVSKPGKGAQKDLAEAENLWSVAEAKARFSEMIERAQAGEAQTITRNGRKVATLVAHHQWQEKFERKGTLADFLVNSPLRGADIRIERIKGKLRDIDL